MSGYYAVGVLNSGHVARQRSVIPRAAGGTGDGGRISNSISLSTGAEVSGDVKSTGGILTNGADVKGEVLPNQADPSDLPEMDLVRPSGSNPQEDKTIYISDYDFEQNPNLQDGRNLTMTPAEARNQTGGLEISEYRVKINTGGTPLELNNGLQLNDGALFVDGDVRTFTDHGGRSLAFLLCLSVFRFR